MIEFNSSDYLRKYQIKLIERGLKDCEDLKARGMGISSDFYDGAIEAFEEMKWQDFEEIEAAWRESQRVESDLYILAGPSPSTTDLAIYWRQRGRTMQFEFVYQRLLSMQVLLEKKEWNYGP